MVSLDREYLVHVHWPSRRVWMIFSDIVAYALLW